MNKIFTSMVAIAVLAGVCAGQTYWKRTYGGPQDDYAFAGVKTQDGNLFIPGYIGSLTDTNNIDLWLLKINPFGDTIWTKRILRGISDGTGDVRYYNPDAVISLKDGNLLLAGDIPTTYTSRAETDSMWLLKINLDGNKIWEKIIGRIGREGSCSLIQTQDGNISVAGHTQTSTAQGSPNNLWLVQITPDGSVLRTKQFMDTASTLASKVIQTLDGNLLIAGRTSLFPWLLKINLNGDILWSRVFSENGYGSFSSMQETQNGEVLVGGYKGYMYYLADVNPSGDVLWEKTYYSDGYDYAYSLLPEANNTFLFAGMTEKFGVGDINVKLLDVNRNGDTVWKMIFGGASDDFIQYGFSTDQGYILVGYTMSSGSGKKDIWLVSIIPDQYACRDSLFTFKIPVSGDSLNHGYAALNMLPGMTMSSGGTISWTPATDSVFMEHMAFVVLDDFGKRDTLTFNLFVNSKTPPVKTGKQPARSMHSERNDITVFPISSREVRFQLPMHSSTLGIYDLSGRLLENIPVTGGRATWMRPKAKTTGCFIAVVNAGRERYTSKFIVK
jgi:hypothetical protein